MRIFAALLLLLTAMGCRERNTSSTAAETAAPFAADYTLFGPRLADIEPIGCTNEETCQYVVHEFFSYNDEASAKMLETRRLTLALKKNRGKIMWIPVAIPFVGGKDDNKWGANPVESEKGSWSQTALVAEECLKDSMDKPSRILYSEMLLALVDKDGPLKTSVRDYLSGRGASSNQIIDFGKRIKFKALDSYIKSNNRPAAFRRAVTDVLDNCNTFAKIDAAMKTAKTRAAFAKFRGVNAVPTYLVNGVPATQKDMADLGLFGKISFTDQRPGKGEVSGTVKMQKVWDESNVARYRLYFGTGPNTLHTKTPIASFEKTGSNLSYEFKPFVTLPDATHFILVASSAELFRIVASTPIDDK